MPWHTTGYEKPSWPRYYTLSTYQAKNAADIFTKVLPWAGLWPLEQPLLFWKGEMMKVIAYLKESITGLRGVTRKTMDTMVSPSTNLLGLQDNVGDTDIESQPVTSAIEVLYVDLLKS
jgi:hypothetical protein